MAGLLERPTSPIQSSRIRRARAPAPTRRGRFRSGSARPATTTPTVAAAAATARRERRAIRAYRREAELRLAVAVAVGATGRNLARWADPGDPAVTANRGGSPGSSPWIGQARVRCSAVNAFCTGCLTTSDFAPAAGLCLRCRVGPATAAALFGGGPWRRQRTGRTPAQPWRPLFPGRPGS